MGFTMGFFLYVPLAGARMLKLFDIAKHMMFEPIVTQAPSGAKYIARPTLVLVSGFGRRLVYERIDRNRDEVDLFPFTGLEEIVAGSDGHWGSGACSFHTTPSCLNSAFF
jgi:hypothetical protein